MEKFTQMKDIPAEPDEEVLFNGKHLDIINFKDTEILKIQDKIVVLPYFRDEAVFLMRLDYIPTYQYKNKDNSELRRITNYLTMIQGTMEEGETPAQTIRRELVEEAGIVLNHLYNFDVEGPYFVQKYSTGRVWLCLLELPINSYRQIKPKTDGSLKEKVSKNIRISIADIDKIVRNYLNSLYLLNKLKSRLDI